MNTETNIFDETADDETAESNIFSEPETNDAEVIFLTKENKGDLLGRFVKTYTFPTEAGRPTEGFHVRMATVAVLKSYEDLKSNSSTSDAQRFTSACKLIADGVCDPDGAVIWDEKELKDLGASNVARFNRMMYAVMDRNGMAKLEDLIREAAKN